MCVACGVEGATVTDSRPSDLGRLRRRRCDSCGHKWTTAETVVSERNMPITIDAMMKQVVAVRNALSDGVRAMDELLAQFSSKPPRDDDADQEIQE